MWWHSVVVSVSLAFLCFHNMFLRLFLFFMSFIFWRSQSHFCQLFFNLGLFHVSSWLDLGYVIFAETSYTSDVVSSVCQMDFFEVQNKRSVKMILILSLPPKNLKSIKKGEAPQKRLWWVKVQQDENAVSGGFQFKLLPGGGLSREEVSPDRSWLELWSSGWLLHVRGPPGEGSLSRWYVKGSWEVTVSGRTHEDTVEMGWSSMTQERPEDIVTGP